MSPPKHNRPANSPNKQSPISKKKKVSDVSTAEVEGQQSRVQTNMAAPMELSAKKLFSDKQDDNDAPPSWFVNFETRFEQRFNNLESLMMQRLFECEEKLKSIDVDIANIRSDFQKVQDVNKTLLDKIDDLENRSRRNNLVFYGVPEFNGLGREDCSKTMDDILQTFVGIPAGDYHLERCHRTPTFQRQPASKPRVIHAAFSSYTTREKVRKACVQKFKATKFHDVKLFVSPDLSQRVLQQRKQKMTQFKQLQQEGKKPFFVFPAIIKYRVNETVMTAS